MELNGKNYEVMYLDDEEKIVIDAMRAGADVSVRFHGATFEETVMRTDQLPKNVLSKRYIQDFTDSSVSFVHFGAENEKGTIELDHYVRVTKKATDRRQA